MFERSQFGDVVLRPMGEEDLDVVLDWRNADTVRRNMYTDHIISPEEHCAWFAARIADESCRLYVAEVDGTGVGAANLVDIKRAHGTCFWGFYLNPFVTARGLGSKIEVAMLDMVFGSGIMRKLNCEVLSSNDRVVSLHEKFGFVHEGLFRGHIMRDGEPVDVVRLALFAEEWEVRRPGIIQRLTARAEGQSARS